MDVGIIIGEATPLTWDRWKHIVQLVERLGYTSLYRSDHYFNGTQKDAIDVYLSFVMAAEESTNLRLGTLVTPVTFREPVNVGRMAQQLDALSDGRFVLGLGAGWYPVEHRVYGIGFPPPSERYDRLDEALCLMKELWYSDSGTFDGSYYRIAGTDSKPHPPDGRPRVLIGGSGPKRTLKIVADHAHEWNTTPLDVEGFRAANAALERHCDAIGRDPAEIRRSMLVFATIGPDDHHRQQALERYLGMFAPAGTTPSLEAVTAAGHGPWQGSVEQLVDYVGQLRDQGLDEVVFEHFCHEDDTICEWIASDVSPRLASL
ncbi:MAG: LLM class flavin-dependent oxidoreductase [Acidimicrobiales bacterium]